jgi:hypothetical protein
MALRRVRTSRTTEGDLIGEDHAEERERDGEEDDELLWRSIRDEPKGEKPSILPQYCVSYGTPMALYQGSGRSKYRSRAILAHGG